MKNYNVVIIFDLKGFDSLPCTYISDNSTKKFKDVFSLGADHNFYKWNITNACLKRSWHVEE